MAAATGRADRAELRAQFDNGGMDRLWVRGRQNVHKKLLIQAAACNLALLMRLRHGSGKPKAAHDRLAGLTWAFWMLVVARQPPFFTGVRSRGRFPVARVDSSPRRLPPCRSSKNEGLDTGC